MIYRYTIQHNKDEYWSVHQDVFVDPAYANRVIEEALADGDWMLMRDWREFGRRAGWMPVGGTGDAYPDLCFTEDERTKLILRGYWRKIANLKVGQSVTVPLVLY